ncbi:hypothetical protein TCAL_13461 [Tigriopus californicus]|uniref:ethanolamine kinase n=1 Tax=Tigriopus californicus TaxID=6832 RepID=A0A553PM33_TIGCA|nr:ethanolamine kinase 2-like [Tigriopus californicus]TRY78738.1 hypothetical protein TCAL_13461 [Tigriopus californicus]|eukprot:TCALIF_13461-PA protein Name:"Similar to ETNK1 Ethanolamine kinase 1 (Homo sapiens)" AED:0.26 eAED:0.26 QI:0/0/0/0.5/1/1/4/0/356
MSLSAILEFPETTVDCSKASKIERGIIKMVQKIRPDWSKVDIILQRFESELGCLIYGAYTTKRSEMIMTKVVPDAKNAGDLNQEITSMRLFASRFFGPRALSAFRNGFTYEYSSGVPLNYPLAIDPKVFPMVAYKIGVMHQEMSKHVVSVRGGHVFNSIRRWMKQVPLRLADPAQNSKMNQELPSKASLERELLELESDLNQPLVNRIVYCHGDLKPSNIIYEVNTETIQFINMECAGPNFQAYEIAQHFIHFNSSDLERVGYDEFVPAKEFQRRWLAFYLSGFKDVPLVQVSPNEVESLLDNVQKFVLVVLLQEVVWALTRLDTFYYPDFDLLQYGILRFKQYHRNKYNILNIII